MTESLNIPSVPPNLPHSFFSPLVSFSPFSSALRRRRCSSNSCLQRHERRTIRDAELGARCGWVGRAGSDLWRRLGSVYAASPSAWTPCCEWARYGSSVRSLRWCRTPECRVARRRLPGFVCVCVLEGETHTRMSARWEPGEEPGQSSPR